MLICISWEKGQRNKTPSKTSPATASGQRLFLHLTPIFIYVYINIQNYISVLFITRMTINNNTPHRKSPENQNRIAALGRPAKNCWGRGKGIDPVFGRPTFTFCFCTPDKTTTNNKKKRIKHKQKAKRAAGIEGHVATMLESYTKQTDTTTIRRKRKKIMKKEQLRGDKTEVPPWVGQQ